MSNNPRLERLKELLSLEERRVAMQAELDGITRRMGTLRDALFDEGATAPVRTLAAKPAKAIAAPKPGRGRRGRKHGALKEQIMTALEAAGAAGVRVKELASTLGVKPVNIHSWFHSTIKRNSAIKKLTGGHYRLDGKASAAAKPAKAPKVGLVRKTGGKRGSAGRRGGLSEKVLGELTKAGSKGIAVRDLANNIGANYRNIYIWFATTGKKNPKIKKVAPAHYKLS